MIINVERDIVQVKRLSRNWLTFGIEVEILAVLITELYSGKITCVAGEFPKNPILGLWLRTIEDDPSWGHLHLVDHS